MQDGTTAPAEGVLSSNHLFILPAVVVMVIFVLVLAH